MAAGLSLDVADFNRFRTAMSALAAERVDPAMLAAELWSDGELFGDEIDLALAEALRDGGPWGQAFPEPQFDGCFDIVSARVVGERHVAMKLKDRSQRTLDAIAFGAYDGRLPSGRVLAVFQPIVDDWRGERRVKLLVRHVEPT